MIVVEGHDQYPFCKRMELILLKLYLLGSFLNQGSESLCAQKQTVKWCFLGE